MSVPELSEDKGCCGFKWEPRQPDLGYGGLDPQNFDNAGSTYHIVLESQIVRRGNVSLRVPRLTLRLQCYNGQWQLGLFAGENIEKGSTICFYGAKLVGSAVRQVA